MKQTTGGFQPWASCAYSDDTSHQLELIGVDRQRLAGATGRPLGAGLPPVIILGDSQPGGVYLLRLHSHQPLTVACGRFKRGQPLFFPPGDYVYVGSALGARGATLTNRLARHANRTADRPPHALRTVLLEHCTAVGLGGERPGAPQPKKLFWHIDYVLNELAVELRGIIALRTAVRLEACLAQWLNADPHTFVVEKGLGASDHHGATHLLGVQADEAWWTGLAAWAQRILNDEG